jgi:hypothetical protein
LAATSPGRARPERTNRKLCCIVVSRSRRLHILPAPLIFQFLLLQASVNSVPFVLIDQHPALSQVSCVIGV